MTFAELQSGLPNALRDAGLAELRYDLLERRLILDLELQVGDPAALTAQARDARRPARLTFAAVERLVFEEPANARLPERAHQPESVSATLESEGPPPPGSEAVSFLRHEVNARLRFLTGGVELEWLEDPQGYA